MRQYVVDAFAVLEGDRVKLAEGLHSPLSLKGSCPRFVPSLRFQPYFNTLSAVVKKICAQKYTPFFSLPS